MAELQGRVLGGYQLAERLASGGIAEVYRARPVRPGGREAVVKVIYPEFARQPGFLPNFRAIVERSSRLVSHPHVLPLLASGEENGYLYLVAPYVAEGNLRDWLQRGWRLGPTDVGPFFKQLAGALAYAHSLGQVHGNLKPSNIFLFEGRHVLVGEFGLLWDVSHLDMNHSGSGTEAMEYLAPEAYSGQVSQATDIYSLGALLFATLVGQPPFRGAKPADLRAAAAGQPVPRLAHVQPTLAPALGTLDAVIQRAMAKRPEERYPSAGAIPAAIEAALAQAPAAPPLSPPMQPPFGQPSFAQAPGMGGFAAPPMSPPNGTAPAAELPWAMAGAPGAGLAVATPPSAGLRPLDPPFPPLPSSGQIEWQMEAGGASLNDPSTVATGGLPSQPTMRVAQPWAAAAPLEEPATMHMPAPAAPEEGLDHHQEMPAIRLAPEGLTPRHQPEPTEALTGAHSEDGQASAFPIWGGRASAPDASLPETSLPGASGPSEAVRTPYRRQHTPAGLPRLTDPVAGEPPTSWAELVSDEMRAVPHAADGEAASERQWSAPIARAEAPHAETQDPWRLEESMAMQAATVGRGRWRRRSKPTDDPDERDSFTQQRVWTVGHTAVKPHRRWRRPLLTLVLLAMILDLSALVLLRPDLCPTPLCQTVHAQVVRLVPQVQMFSTQPPAPLAASPPTVDISLTAGEVATRDLSVRNTGKTAVAWQAAPETLWLAITPPTGTLEPGASAALKAVATPTGVPPGTYTSAIVLSVGPRTLRVPVKVVIGAGAQLSSSPNALTFTTCGTTQPVTIKNVGQRPLTFTLSATQSGVLRFSTTGATVAPQATATVDVTLLCAAQRGRPYAIVVVSDGGSAQIAVRYG